MFSHLTSSNQQATAASARTSRSPRPPKLVRGFLGQAGEGFASERSRECTGKKKLQILCYKERSNVDEALRRSLREFLLTQRRPRVFNGSSSIDIKRERPTATFSQVINNRQHTFQVSYLQCSNVLLQCILRCQQPDATTVIIK